MAAPVPDGAMGVGEDNGLPVHYFTGKVLVRVSD